MSEEENPSEEQENVVDESDSSEDLLEDWPFSNNFILAAILLLVAAAFTLAFRTEEQANQYAIWAYYALVIGVVLRFVEIILDERFDIELKPYVYRKLEPLKLRFYKFIQEVFERARSSSYLEAPVNYVEKAVKNLYSRLNNLNMFSKSKEDGEIVSEESENKYTGRRPEVGFLQRLIKYRFTARLYVCEECDAMFDNVEDLKDHKKLHQ